MRAEIKFILAMPNCRANESRAELVLVMPSAADNQLKLVQPTINKVNW